MIHKLRRKFIAITMASVILVMLLVGISINAFNYISTNRDLNDTLELIYENEGAVPQSPGSFKPGDSRKNRFTEETPYSTRYFVLRYTEDGMLTNANMKHIAAVTVDDAKLYMDIARKHGEGFGVTGSYKYYVAKNGTDKYMAVFLDCHDELHALQTFAVVSSLVIVGCVVLVFVLVLLLSKRAITPMIKNMEMQKQFITDASHELKTPLTVINTSLKVLEMDIGESKWIDKIQRQTDKLTRLVNDLVTLSQLEEGLPSVQISDFDISAAVAEIADSFRDYAAAEGHRLETEIVPELHCRGDEYAVRQMVSILLDNAVKYSDAGGTIWLRLREEKDAILLQTENPCAALEAEEPEKLFDRFYRADKSRSNQTPGFGIGLSVARGIAQAHRGTIMASCSSNGIVRFSVVLR